MLVAFSGLQGSGKDTGAAALIKIGYKKVAFADALRDMLIAIDPFIPVANSTCRRLSDIISDVGWDYAKRTIPEVRRIMQRTGTEGVRNVLGNNSWVNALHNNYSDLFDADTRYVLTDCRFDNEGEFVHQHGGLIIWIDRPNISSDGHASESLSLRSIADNVIANDGSITDLQHKIVELLQKGNNVNGSNQSSG